MVVNTFPPPKLLRPERIPRGPQVRYGIDGYARTLPATMTIQEASARMVRLTPKGREVASRIRERNGNLFVAKPWQCDHCGATGTGCADDGFANEEAEHCLSGCNGSLRATGA